MAAAVHIRKKPSKGAPLWDGGGRTTDQHALESISPEKAKRIKFKGCCKRCTRNMKAAQR